MARHKKNETIMLEQRLENLEREAKNNKTYPCLGNLSKGGHHHNRARYELEKGMIILALFGLACCIMVSLASWLGQSL